MKYVILAIFLCMSTALAAPLPTDPPSNKLTLLCNLKHATTLMVYNQRETHTTKELLEIVDHQWNCVRDEFPHESHVDMQRIVRDYTRKDKDKNWIYPDDNLTSKSIIAHAEQMKCLYSGW